MSALQEAKLLLIGGTDLAKDALHIYAGLLLFFLAAALLRWPIRGWRPWAAVLVMALAGEAWDIADTLRAGSQLRPDNNWHDIWNTLFWPTAIMLMARWTTVLSRR
jgi:hypothetical protein